jgi:DNA-binding protein HU-beta
MNQQELVATIARETGVAKKVVNAILLVTLDEIQAAVARGDKVILVGFGIFERRERRAREGRNPKTGKPMAVPATCQPAFRPGKLFREAVVVGELSRSD